MLKYIREDFIMTKQIRLDIKTFLPEKTRGIFMKIYKLAACVWIVFAITCIINKLIGKNHPFNDTLYTINVVIASVAAVCILFYSIRYFYYVRKGL
ncbi:hypothetical protein ACO11K_000585 [Bacillus cytotoxicus]|uniref:hypothetical protein n=1 Tax=Bacillus cereus group sp. BfR-BA-01492 TaxID=2920361 RepID=UPI001F57F015|nr:hypothetical protein [Bacillus cereus group sp. BfR-BA-01492]EMA6344316.1 hypothetical protein [Bacillus cytotoxicus]EMA6345349.1 hypothetical protein [Bacillus cytotoxicus]